jgi:hypothetical protein
MKNASRVGSIKGEQGCFEYISVRSVRKPTDLRADGKITKDKRDEKAPWDPHFAVTQRHPFSARKCMFWGLA